MITYLIKSILCQVILLLVYHLWIEREKNLVFNRYYLLGSWCFSLVIPFLVLPKLEQTTTLLDVPIVNDIVFNPAPTLLLTRDLVEASFSFEDFLFWSYLVITFLLVIRFIKNLNTLYQQIKTAQKSPYHQAKLILINEKISPYTFFKYIFIHKKAYENGSIEEELLVHELAHAKAFHTLDVLLIEFFLLFFWFNPLLFFYKKAIKLNHEYLADDAVNQQFKNIPSYQRLLLNKTFLQPPTVLVNTLGYSLTKKRFLMMLQKKSSKRASIKKILLVPLFLVLILVFSAKFGAGLIGQKPVPTPQKSPKKVVNQIPSSLDSIRAAKIKYYKGATIGFLDENGKVSKKRIKEMSDEEIDRYVMPVPPPPTNTRPTQAQLEDFKNAKKYGLWIDGKRAKNSVLNNYKASDFADYQVSRLAKNATHYGRYTYQLHLDTPAYFEAWAKEFIKEHY